MGYLGVFGECEAERVIEKSRFLAYAGRTEGEEEARAFLTRIRAAHPLATHVTYGFVADRAGNLQRFSDDGEPQGTAGMPILGVLKARELRESTVAVVRYFGGIKLGAGGLTRAYASAAADVLAAAELRRFEPCVEFSLKVGYADVGAALRFLEGSELLGRDFGEDAVFRVAVRECDADRFRADACDCFNGKCALTEEARRCYPFRTEAAERKE